MAHFHHQLPGNDHQQIPRSERLLLHAAILLVALAATLAALA
jgi:hypothetical protein